MDSSFLEYEGKFVHFVLKSWGHSIKKKTKNIIGILLF